MQQGRGCDDTINLNSVHAFVLKGIVRAIVVLIYRVRVIGMANYSQAGSRVLIVANHTSFLDGVLLTLLLPDRLTFAVNTEIAKKWWVKPFLMFVEFVTVDTSRPFSLRGLIRAIEAGRRVVIFPEGRITLTGALMKVYPGTAMVADRARAQILPVAIDGPQFSPLARFRGLRRRRWFPEVRITLLSPRGLSLPAGGSSRLRRDAGRQQLADMLSETVFVGSHHKSSLFQALRRARRRYGRKHPVINDINRRPLTYGKFVSQSLQLGELMARGLGQDRYVGLLLPNSIAAALSLFGATAFGRVPVMLPDEQTPAEWAECAEQCGIRHIYTSRRFLESKGCLDRVGGLFPGVRVVFLEDVRDSLTRMQRWSLSLSASLRESFYPFWAGTTQADDVAVIQFVRNSYRRFEPIQLSHDNILANCRQIRSRIDVVPTDVFFNALSLSSAWGLGVGLVLPLTEGAQVFCYVSSRHYRIATELIYEFGATVFFATRAMLQGYAEQAHQYDFYRVRYCFTDHPPDGSGLHQTWFRRFGVRLFVAYGKPQCGPIIAINTPLQHKEASVGKLLPAMSWKLDHVAEDGSGRLWVSGPNVLGAPGPGTGEEQEYPWFNTGDCVQVDGDGFIYPIDVSSSETVS